MPDEIPLSHLFHFHQNNSVEATTTTAQDIERLHDNKKSQLPIFEETVLLLCEIWLGYCFWTVTEIFFFVFDINYDYVQTDKKFINLFYVLLATLASPILLMLHKNVRFFFACHTNELRIITSLVFFVLPMQNHVLKWALVSFGAVLCWVSWISSFSVESVDNFLIKMQNFLKKYKLSSEILSAVEFDRRQSGWLMGLFLLICLKQFDISRNPVWAHTFIQVLFGVLNIGCALFLILVKRKFPFVRRFITNEDTVREPAKAPVVLEVWSWFFVGISLGSICFIILMIFTSADTLPRWIGWHPFPWNFPVAALFCIGLMLAPVAPDSPVWYPLTIIGGCFFTYNINLAGYTGGLLVALSLPSAFYQLRNEIWMGSRTIVPMMLVALSTFFAIGMAGYAGTVRGAQQGDFGRQFIRSRQNFLLPLFVGLGLFLIPKTVRLFLSTYNTLFSITSPKEKFRSVTKELATKLFLNFQKPPKSHLIICGLLFGIWTVAFVTRGVREAKIVKEPTESLTVMTYNILQGHHPKSADLNLKEVCDVVKLHRINIAGLQESDSLHPWTQSLDSVGWLSDCLRYHSQYGIPNSQFTWNAALLSAFDLKNCNTVTLPAINDWMYNYPLITCQITFLGTTVTIMNTYTTFFNKEQRNASRVMAEFVATVANNTEGPLILTADINATPKDSTYKIYRNAGLMDAYYEFNGKYPERTFGGHTVFDYIFYKNLDVMDAFVMEEAEGISDHLPVIATFMLHVDEIE